MVSAMNPNWTMGHDLEIDLGGQQTSIIDPMTLRPTLRAEQ